MKRIILGLTVIVMVVMAIGCTHSTPESVVETYFDAIQQKDYEKAADCFYYGDLGEEDANDARDMNIDLMKKVYKSFKEKGGVESYKILTVDEDGDNAVVKGVLVFVNGDTQEETVKAIKRDGKWYLEDGK